MRKSNSREARRAIDSYVLDEVSDILERCEIVEPLRPVEESYKVLLEEMRYQTNFADGRDVRGIGYLYQYREAGRRVDFIAANNPYWVWYLASACGCFAVYYDEMRELVAQWLDETPEESSAYSNDEVAAMYRHMTAKSFERLHEKETTPHKVKTSEFIRLYEEKNGGSYFDRETLRYYGQTRKSFTITAFHLVEDYRGTIHDCYRVESSHIDAFGNKSRVVDHFDRVTLELVHHDEESEAAQGFTEYMRECLAESLPCTIADCYDFAARETKHEEDYYKRQMFAADLADKLRNCDEITALINRVMMEV